MGVSTKGRSRLWHSQGCNALWESSGRGWRLYEFHRHCTINIYAIRLMVATVAKWYCCFALQYWEQQLSRGTRRQTMLFVIYINVLFRCVRMYTAIDIVHFTAPSSVLNKTTRMHRDKQPFAIAQLAISKWPLCLAVVSNDSVIPSALVLTKPLQCS